MSDTHVDRGIWKTDHGFRIVVRIGPTLHTKRFPPTYTLDKLRQWRDDHIKRHRPKKATRGTFAADAERYLNTVQSMASYGDRARDIQAWADALGDTARWRITPELVRGQLSAWKAAGLAASTVNHRRTALSHLYTVLDGKNEYNPVREVPPFEEPGPQKRGLPMPLVMKVLKRIHGPKTRARLEVLAWTGMRPSELMRLTPDMVDLRAGIARVPTTKGGPPREIAFALARQAWKKLLKADALGEFSVQSTRKSLVRACKAANVTPFRVYDLRHSFLSALRKSGADLSDVQAQAGHSSISLTRRYAPTVTAKLKQAVGRMSPQTVTRKRKRAKSGAPERA